MLNKVSHEIIPYLIHGLLRVNKIILADAYSTFAWLLVINDAVGLERGNNLIVYYNSENVEATTSLIIHELIHKAINLSNNDLISRISNEALAYLASFKSNFTYLYMDVVRQVINALANCVVLEDRLFIYEIASIFLPRLIANKIVKYKFHDLVTKVFSDKDYLIKLYIAEEDNEDALTAFTIALQLLDINVKKYGLRKISCEPIKLSRGNEISRVPETEILTLLMLNVKEIDNDYVEMKKLIFKAKRNPSKAKLILKPWWNQIKPIEDELINFLLSN